MARVLIIDDNETMREGLGATVRRMGHEALLATSITLVSVSHHPALVRYHSQVLELKAGGDWRLHSAAKFRFTPDLV